MKAAFFYIQIKVRHKGIEEVAKPVGGAGDVSIKAKIMIDGAPVTQSYADEIGADGYAPDAASAVDKAKSF